MEVPGSWESKPLLLPQSCCQSLADFAEYRCTDMNPSTVGDLETVWRQQGTGLILYSRKLHVTPVLKPGENISIASASVESTK